MGGSRILVFCFSPGNHSERRSPRALASEICGTGLRPPDFLPHLFYYGAGVGQGTLVGGPPLSDQAAVLQPLLLMKARQEPAHKRLAAEGQGGVTERGAPVC